VQYQRRHACDTYVCTAGEVDGPGQIPRRTLAGSRRTAGNSDGQKDYMYPCKRAAADDFETSLSAIPTETAGEVDCPTMLKGRTFIHEAQH
jgi:hypothetical protein